MPSGRVYIVVRGRSRTRDGSRPCKGPVRFSADVLTWAHSRAGSSRKARLPSRRPDLSRLERSPTSICGNGDSGERPDQGEVLFPEETSIPGSGTNSAAPALITTVEAARLLGVSRYT